MKKIIKAFLFTLAFLSFNLIAAKRDCVTNGLTHIEANMPQESIEWHFAYVDDLHTQASLLFPKELNGAVFFQVFVQKEDNTLYEYAFPLEALDHPLTTEVKQIEFIIVNEQLSDLVINIHYLEPGYRECSDMKSYSYSVKTS